MENDKYKNYLKDLGVLTAEYAREAIQDEKAAKGTSEEGYKTGYAMGFHSFITLMQQQAVAFEIPLDEIGLAKFEESEFFQSQK